MRKSILTRIHRKLIIDVINLIIFSATSIVGLIIQFNYHMGHHPASRLILGYDRGTWHDLHIVLSLMAFAGLVYHTILNFPAVKAVFISRKRNFSSSIKLSRWLVVIMLLTCITGITSYIFYLFDLHNVRIHIVEIHDKLGILVTIICAIHIVQHFKNLTKMIVSEHGIRKLSDNHVKFSQQMGISNEK
jgi:hypothetical protein